MIRITEKIVEPDKIYTNSKFKIKIKIEDIPLPDDYYLIQYTTTTQGDDIYIQEILKKDSETLDKHGIILNNWLQEKREILKKIKLVDNSASLENASYLFYNFPNLIKVDLTKFNTSNVIYMTYMFANSSNLEELMIYNMDTRKVVDTRYMFKGYSGYILDCPQYINLDTDTNGMFDDCTSIVVNPPRHISSMIDFSFTQFYGPYSSWQLLDEIILEYLQKLDESRLIFFCWVDWDYIRSSERLVNALAEKNWTLKHRGPVG